MDMLSGMHHTSAAHAAAHAQHMAAAAAAGHPAHLAAQQVAAVQHAAVAAAQAAQMHANHHNAAAAAQAAAHAAATQAAYGAVAVGGHGGYGGPPIGPPQQAPMAGSMVPNQNSRPPQDPAAQRARVFVGNLNTMQMEKGELEEIFGKYGPVLNTSVHKGYAFVQYADEWTARSAVQNEDQRFYYNMKIDVNLANEPKPRQRGGSQHGHVAQHSWGGSVAGVNNGGMSGPPVKRSRGNLAGGGGGSGNLGMNSGVGGGSGRQNSNLVSLVTPCNPVPSSQTKRTPTLYDRDVKDLLMCGNCKEVFQYVDRLIAHKKLGCRLRFVCRCKQTGEPRTLDCAYCGKEYLSSWELIRHCQKDHDLTVFTTKSPLPPDPSDSTSVKSETVTTQKKKSVDGSGATEKSDEERGGNGSTDDEEEESADSHARLFSSDAREIITMSRQQRKKRKAEADDDDNNEDEEDEVEEVILTDLTEPHSPPSNVKEEEEEEEDESDDEDSNRRRLRSRKTAVDK